MSPTRTQRTKRIQVRLNRRDAQALRRAAALETQRRGEPVGGSTLLRELAMPLVRNLLQESEPVEVIRP